jgi:hypothetical protein
MIHSAIYRPQSCVPSPPLGRCGHGAACIVWTIQGFLPEEPIGHVVTTAWSLTRLRWSFLVVA